ncbi:hypothetical protein ABIF86_000245 [Bradyrhizobium japonicum]
MATLMETRCVALSTPWCADDPGSDGRECGSRQAAPDMRGGFPSLALQVQEVLHKDPLNGPCSSALVAGSYLLKMIWRDGQGACLFTKRLERGRFISYGLCQLF